MPRRRPPLDHRVAAAAAATLLLSGCVAPPGADRADERRRLARFDYPAQAPFGPDLDVVVRRDGEAVVLNNRTTSSRRDVQLWLNRQYVREVPLIAIGPNPRMGLTRWINRHGEGFPVGTLLSPDAAAALVLAELYDPRSGLRHRLLAWPDDR